MATGSSGMAEAAAAQGAVQGTGTAEGHRPLLAAAWMSGSILGFSAMAVAGRTIGGRLDTFEIMFWRSLIGVGLLLALAELKRRRSGEWPITTRALPLHVLRNVLHFTGQNLWFYALTLIPLAQLFALEFSYPIMVALAAPFVLGERLQRVKLATAAMGFLGILVVSRPWAEGGMGVGAIAAFLAAVGFAGSALTTKRLTRRVSTFAILFWLCTIQLCLAAAFVLRDGGTPVPGLALWPPLLVIGLGGLIAHGCLTTALSLAPASVVVPVDFLRLPLIAVVGMALYGEPFDPVVIAGGAVILAANWINLRADARAARQAA